MITQKLISLKIDRKLLDELDKEANLGYNNRNRLINEAIRFYLLYKDIHRRMRMINNRSHQENILEEFAREWFPEVYDL